MNISLRGSNIILAVLVLGLLGCKSAEEKTARRQATFLRFHLETNLDGTRYSAPASIYRAQPMLLTVERDAVLDEGYMLNAELVDTDEYGGFAIRITFDEAGTRRLHAVTTANKGRRLAVNARWTETRWLAAPLIRRNIAEGVFVFTPDASREETERIVSGLNNVIKKLRKNYTF